MGQCRPSVFLSMLHQLSRGARSPGLSLTQGRDCGGWEVGQISHNAHKGAWITLATLAYFIYKCSHFQVSFEYRINKAEDEGSFAGSAWWFSMGLHGRSPNTSGVAA